MSRAVDADDILPTLIYEGQDNASMYGFNPGDTIRFTPVQVANIVKKMPTIEPERKHGHWIKEENRGQLYRCSACGNSLDFRGVTAGRGSANYCPNCGVDMREGERNAFD